MERVDFAVVKRLFSGSIIRRRLLLLIGLSAYFALVYIIFDLIGITCVFKHLFGIPCPACNMTRAFLRLVRLDIVGAFRLNPLIFAMPYVFAFIFFDFKNKRLHNTILLLIGAAALLNWGFNIL